MRTEIISNSDRNGSNPRKTTEEISIKSNRGRSQTRILALLVLQGATIESIEREQIFKDRGKTFKLKRE